MYAEDECRFANLRIKMESDWVPRLKLLLGLDSDSLPAIWDADFMYGPKDYGGADSYVLGEINVGAVIPFPKSVLRRSTHWATPKTRSSAFFQTRRGTAT
jgi:hypothetical protein